MPGEVSGVVVESLFLSDSFFLLEEGVCFFLEVLLVAGLKNKYSHWRMTAFPICLFKCLRTKKLIACISIIVTLI